MASKYKSAKVYSLLICLISLPQYIVDNGIYLTDFYSVTWCRQYVNDTDAEKNSPTRHKTNTPLLWPVCDKDWWDTVTKLYHAMTLNANIPVINTVSYP